MTQNTVQAFFARVQETPKLLHDFNTLIQENASPARFVAMAEAAGFVFSIEDYEIECQRIADTLSGGNSTNKNQPKSRFMASSS